MTRSFTGRQDKEKRGRQAYVAGGEVAAMVVAKWLDASYFSHRFEAENTLILVRYKTDEMALTTTIEIKKPAKTYRFILKKGYNFLNIFKKNFEMKDSYWPSVSK